MKSRIITILPFQSINQSLFIASTCVWWLLLTTYPFTILKTQKISAKNQEFVYEFMTHSLSKRISLRTPTPAAKKQLYVARDVGQYQLQSYISRYTSSRLNQRPASIADYFLFFFYPLILSTRKLQYSCLQARSLP